MKDYKSLSSTTQERIRDLLRPVLGEVDDPKAAQMSQAELSRMLGINSAIRLNTGVFAILQRQNKNLLQNCKRIMGTIVCIFRDNDV